MAPFLPKNAFPLPAPLRPTLVALGLDTKTAAAVSSVYISTAFSLKETFEGEYVRACNVFVSTGDNCGHSSKELRSKLLTVAIARYRQALSQWVQGTIERAKESLGRKKCAQKPKASAWFQLFLNTCVNLSYRSKSFLLAPSLFKRAIPNCLANRGVCLPL